MTSRAASIARRTRTTTGGDDTDDDRHHDTEAGAPMIGGWWRRWRDRNVPKMPARELMLAIGGHGIYIRDAQIIAVRSETIGVSASLVAADGMWDRPDGSVAHDVRNITADIGLASTDPDALARMGDALRRWSARSCPVDAIGWRVPSSSTLVINHADAEAIGSGPSSPIQGYVRLLPEVS